MRLRAGLERRIMADPNVICLAVSEMIAGHFREYYGREQGVRVAFNGVDVPDWTDEHRSDQRQQVRLRLGVRAVMKLIRLGTHSGDGQ